MELCRQCAEKVKTRFDIFPVVVGVDRKATCAGCGRRRFSAVYKIIRTEG